MLTIELVPRSCWFSNVRSQVSKDDWDMLRKACYKKAKNLCQICGGKGPTHPVECHEIWDYEDAFKTQTLVSLIALCPACHEVKHIGLAKVRGRYQQALAHLMKVNEWSLQDASHYVDACFEQWAKRSQHPWELDLTYLELLGVEYDGRQEEEQAQSTSY